MAGMSVNDQMGHGTIKAPSSIDAEADAGILRKAMKGMGKCDSRSSERVGGGGLLSCALTRWFT